jgi:hypothetical protein
MDVVHGCWTDSTTRRFFSLDRLRALMDNDPAIVGKKKQPRHYVHWQKEWCQVTSILLYMLVVLVV